MKIKGTIKNNLPSAKPVKEKMSTIIEKINPNLPRANGSVYCLIGPPGGGKSSLLLSLFSKEGGNSFYRNKFDNIYLITPESSFLSVSNHPFKTHEKVFHELTAELLETIYDNTLELKIEALENKTPIEHTIVIVDDYASDLKENDIIQALKKILTKSRHINTFFIFTLQAYNLFPMILRKLITHITLFKPKNNIEFENIRTEILNTNKDDSLKLFNFVFDKPYNHLTIDTKTNEKRKNFELIEFEE
jgi:hypothetical protein